VPPLARCAMPIRATVANKAKLNRGNPIPDVVSWQQPFEGFGKLNVDAAFHAEQGTGATVTLIRDASGNFSAGSCQFLSNVTVANMAKPLQCNMDWSWPTKMATIIERRSQIVWRL
jgi:hypothetical protein